MEGGGGEEGGEREQKIVWSLIVIGLGRSRAVE